MSERRAIFVTGAASGMGEATARLFADRGWFVGGYDVDARGIARIADELGGAGVFETLDVTDVAAFDAAIARFGAASGGRMDVLHNNAGIIAHGLFEDMAWDAIERIVRVNLFGPMIGIRASLPLLKATPNALCYTTCSASAIFGAAGLSIYSATKHGVRGLTEAIAPELALHGIRVGDVLPGIIETGMVAPEHKPFLAREGMWRLLSPSAVAEAVWAAYHADHAPLHSYVPPELRDHEAVVRDQPDAVLADATERLRQRQSMMKATAGSPPDAPGRATTA